MWLSGIRIGPSSKYQPSSLFLSVNTRPPVWLLASKMVTWRSEELLTFLGRVVLSPHPTSHLQIAIGSGLEALNIQGNLSEAVCSRGS